jgi:hypothetical protein
LVARNITPIAEGRGHTPRVAHVSPQGHALLEQRDCPCVLAQAARHEPQVAQRGRSVRREPPPSGEETLLTELEPGVFRVGAAAYSPERLRFDTIVDGQALRARLSTCDYYRFFTP